MSYVVRVVRDVLDEEVIQPRRDGSAQRDPRGGL